MSEEEAKIYNWILDSFGQPVFTGDWIIFQPPRFRRLVIGKISSFTEGRNPRVFCRKFPDNKMQYLGDKKGLCANFGSGFVKITNSELLEDLNKELNGIQR